MNFLLLLLLLILIPYYGTMINTLNILANQSLHVEEYGTIKFECTIEGYILAAWRIRLRHDHTYRYYYIEWNLRNQLLHDDEEQEDDRSRDVNFENNGFTMIFLNVHQWMNNAFESIECVVYNNETNIFQRLIFDLHVYVRPFSFSLEIDNILARDQSIFLFDDNQSVNIMCQVYSYPKSTLQLMINHQQIQINETIECVGEDLSTILLSNSLCLTQTNWRVRVRASAIINLSKDYNRQNLSCSIIDFPYRISKSTLRIQLIESKEKTITPSIPNAFFRTSSSSSSLNIDEQTKSNDNQPTTTIIPVTAPGVSSSFIVSVIGTLSTIKPADKFLQEKTHHQIRALVIFGFVLFVLFILIVYVFYRHLMKNKMNQSFTLPNSILPK